MLSGRAILSSMTDRAFAAASLTAPPDQMVGVYIAENDIGVGQRGLGAAAVVAHRTRRSARTLRPATTEDAPAAVSQRTLRWREQDSNHRFRGGRAQRFVCRFSFAPTFRLAGTNQRRFERLVVSRGTDGSNPVPSSNESAANLFLGRATTRRSHGSNPVPSCTESGLTSPFRRC